MASKKYLFLAGLFSLLVTTAAFGQSPSMTGGHDYLDTAYVPASRMQQQQSFLKNQSIYPAKPRDMWELGFGAGYHFIAGDIDARPGFGGSITIRKSLGHVFSLRAGYTGSFDYGMDYRLRQDFVGPWAAYAGSAGYVANYRTRTHDLSLDAIASLSSIKFYNSAPKWNFYVLAGYSLLAADVDVNALDASGNPYNFSGINFGAPRKDIKKAVKAMLDKSYEDNAPSGGNRVAIGRYKNNWLLRHGIDLGAGVARKISKRVNVQFEQKFTFVPGEDYLDGVNAGKSNDFYSYTSLGINFDLGNTAKRVSPLWWENPLDYAYSELNSPRHMKIPTPTLPDADGDGVADQFDRCPNTPAGVAVDVHGCPLDTDGDGVPDYKDKQLITPTYCQPVDADGVGKCPDPECCKNKVAACNIGSLPSITFKGRSVALAASQKQLLESVANQMRSNPECRVVVTGHAEASKASEQLSWDRVNAVITYLTETQGISADRFIFQYSGVPGDTHTVDLRGASDADQGPNMVPPPHPDLRRSK